MCKDFVSAVSNLSIKLRESLYKIPNDIKKCAQDICIKSNKRVIIFTPNESFFLGSGGKISSSDSEIDDFITSQEDIFDTMKILCNFSICSSQNQIKEGSITLKGGHRVGLCGTAIVRDKEVIDISNISSINLRISREIPGCSEEIFKELGIDIGGTLIIGGPSSGKTTILRDISKKISSTKKNGCLIKTVIVDERREIASVHNGIAQKDIGMCDILNGFPKSEGITRATRVISPEIIVCDEIESCEEAEKITKSLNCGVKIICSAHSSSTKEISNSKIIQTIISSGTINHVVLLNGSKTPGTVNNIFAVK